MKRHNFQFTTKQILEILQGLELLIEDRSTYLGIKKAQDIMESIHTQMIKKNIRWQK